MNYNILCYASNSLCALSITSFVLSDPKLKTHRSVLPTKIKAISSNIIPDTGVDTLVFRFLLYIYIHTTRVVPLPYTTP